ncbi:MAG: phosphoesterase [Rhodospirillaceae bacterium]|nr:phosphoesterase [Rhodospirillaceae bacterium]|tara:strand:+ start:7964 stop:8689 length:726 start_codon:yes stop_codon:yes gene_type:complete
MLLNGHALVPDVSGGLYWPERRVFVAADLHFEKGSAYARHGALLPPYDSRATLERLDEAVTRLSPELVICLGDSFHDQDAADRLDEETHERLRSFTSRTHWFWVAGNHDPHPPAKLGGDCVEALAVGTLEFRHEPRPGPATGEICGHLHPSASVGVKGRSLRRRCFVSDGARLIMPAFGAYTGGLDVFEDAISGLFPGGFNVWLLGRDRVRCVEQKRLSVPARLASTAASAKMATATEDGA